MISHRAIKQIAALDPSVIEMMAGDIADVLDRYHAEAGLDLSADDLAPGLALYLAGALDMARRAAELDGWYPPFDAPRTAAGDLMHTCNDGNPAGLPFGHKAPEGECARCDELRRGAAPRAGGPRSPR